MRQEDAGEAGKDDKGKKKGWELRRVVRETRKVGELQTRKAYFRGITKIQMGGVRSKIKSAMEDPLNNLP